MWRVVDSAFNRQWYSSLIGMTFHRPPSYAQVEKVDPIYRGSGR
jgi:hypothetical protein